ncbi:MAG TPA: guanylate kinase [Gemmatimonadales bacterium]|nr:guanylate kinase [Gemmatimonadales bacterium]
MTPKVVILSAPSGGGKTAVTRALLERYPNRFGYSVSATTRKPRPGEREGKAYHFISREEFKRRVEAGEFLEWAQYAGELYGTLKKEVEEVLKRGLNVLLDIEVKGARQVRSVYVGNAITVFLIPPTAGELLKRLRERKTESSSEIARRVSIAVEEIQIASQDIRSAIVYDHVVVNDDLDLAVARIVEIVDQPEIAKHRTMDMIKLIEELIRDLQSEAHHLQSSIKEHR